MYKLRCKWETKMKYQCKIERKQDRRYRYRKKYFIVLNNLDYIRTFQNIINSAD